MGAASEHTKRSDRRAFLRYAAIGGGAAALAAVSQAEADSGDEFRLGEFNDADNDQTTLVASVGADAALDVENMAGSGIGIRGINDGGYGVWGEGQDAGVRGIGDTVGVLGQARDSTGIGIMGRRGDRSSSLPTNTGILGFAAFGTGLVGEGGGATGIRGFSGQYNGTSGPIGVGIQGIGTNLGVQGIGPIGVEGRATGSGTAVRAIAASTGKAIDATGTINVVGAINAIGTITGTGSSVGVVARSATGGTSLRAFAPADGVAIEAVGNAVVGGDATVSGDLSVSGDLPVGGNLRVKGTLSGNGSGLAALKATALTGTVHPDRISGAFARRDRFNIFGRNNQFRGTVKMESRIQLNAANRATVKDGKTSVDVTVNAKIVMGPTTVVIVTPQEDPHGLTFFARVLTSRTFRIGLSGPAPTDITFGYLVLN